MRKAALSFDIAKVSKLSARNRVANPLTKLQMKVIIFVDTLFLTDDIIVRKGEWENDGHSYNCNDYNN